MTAHLRDDLLAFTVAHSLFLRFQYGKLTGLSQCRDQLHFHATSERIPSSRRAPAREVVKLDDRNLRLFS
jgi:hypothetical protein